MAWFKVWGNWLVRMGRRVLNIAARFLRYAIKTVFGLIVRVVRAAYRLPPIARAADAIGDRLQPVLASLRHHKDVWMAAWAHESSLPDREPIGSKELEFLPAVLEIQESPPSPVGRAVAGAIIGVFAVGVLWASFGKIDIIAVAKGKIIPSDYSKVIQPLESGVIKAIHVRDGQAVKKGDVLIELDPTEASAEQARLTNEQALAQVDAARLRALIAGEGKLRAPKDANPRLVALEQQRLRDQLMEYQSKLEAARLLVEQRSAALEATKVNIERLEQTVPMLNQRADAFKKLADEHFVSQVQYLEIESQRVDKVKELAGQRHKLVQDQAALAEAQKSYSGLESEFRQARRAELADAQTKSVSLSNEVVKAGQKTSQQTLTAPIDGIVQQLAVHTIGGVVTPAQQLLVVVPKEHQLEVEAWVENKDIGFVNPDQAVEVKVETFPFTRYGTIDGKVITVSQDAVPIDKVGLVYTARVLMNRSKIQVENKQVNLAPGMAVTVEIKTGQRRLIEYFLSPLLRYKDESVRER
jgi:hemolysin D